MYRASGRISASSLGERCPRFVVMRALGIPRYETATPDHHSLLDMFVGTAVHKEYQLVMERTGVLLRPEGLKICECGKIHEEEFHLISPELNLSGYADVIREGLLEEVKVVKTGSFFYPPLSEEKGRENNVEQVVAYYLCIEDMAANDVLPFDPPDEYHLVYLARERDRRDEFHTLRVPVPVKELAPKVATRVRNLNAALERVVEGGAYPPCLCTRGFGGREFAYCDYRGPSGTARDCCQVGQREEG